VTGREGWGYSTDKVRLLFSRHLHGSGIELGPGHHPYAITLPNTTVRYVDRWESDENKALFPELGEAAEFPQPDVVANLDKDLLSAFEDASLDFVIGSHLIEHVANPILLLRECHRALRAGGVLMLYVPDMRRTSDARRTPTTLEHLVDELERGVDEVDEDHLRDYVRNVEQFTGDEEALQARFEIVRKRSLHVHCWDEPDFFPVLEHLVGELGCGFELVELILSDDIRGSKEFGYVLRKPVQDLPPEQLRERLVAVRDLLLRTRRAQGEWSSPDSAVALKAQIAERDRTIKALNAAQRDQQKLTAAAQARLDAVNARLERLRSSPAYPVWKAARKAQRAVLKRARAQRG
jgi:SAM-dependent methyltransferase/uncharacterized coiled-coil protein SlyX